MRAQLHSQMGPAENISMSIQTLAHPSIPSLIDLTGRTFGQLTVLARAGGDSRRRATWTCRCSCGAVRTVRSDNLRSGYTASCGDVQLHPHVKHGTSSRYQAIHEWLRRQLGSASEYACTVCGRPACDWSYLGGAPDEQRLPDGWAHSADPAYYQPRCRSCHAALDAAARRA